MREERRNIFVYLSHMIMIFGVMMLCMMCFTILFGDSAKEISSMYALGSEGVPVRSMLEFFILSGIITLIRFTFAHNIFSGWSVVGKTISMILVMLIVMIIFIVLFQWFPINQWEPWIMFFFSFAVCFILSTVVCIWKEKVENKQLEEGLKKIKKQWGEDDGIND